MIARWQKILVNLTLWLLIMSLAGCAGPSQEANPKPPDANPGEVKLATANIQREASPSVDQSLLDHQVAANNDFAFDLYQALRSLDGNLFYSPYSLSVALAMTYGGARGETERQIAATLHYTLPQDQLHPALNALDQSLNSANSSDTGFRLNVVNSLWGQEQFPFLPDFLTLIARNYGAGIRLVDFTSDASRETARQTINGWVSQQTQDKIKDLLPPQMLNEFTRLVLVNAIYFKGEWQDPFLNGTLEAPFILLNSDQVAVPMMSRREETPYIEGDGYRAVALPYKGDRVEMIVVMPEAGKFAEFESSLNQANIDDIITGLQSRDVALLLPKFTFSFRADMKEILSQMGMPAAFDPGKANFTGIDDKKLAPGNLFISHVAHQAYVAVDEKGTEAAAASGVVASDTSMPIVLRVDHPFFFIIRDRQTGSILFVGRLLNPKNAS